MGIDGIDPVAPDQEDERKKKKKKKRSSMSNLRDFQKSPKLSQKYKLVYEQYPGGGNIKLNKNSTKILPMEAMCTQVRQTLAPFRCGQQQKSDHGGPGALVAAKHVRRQFQQSESSIDS